MSTPLHKYYKKSFDGLLILVQLDPINLKGVELIVDKTGQIMRTDREFDEDIYQDLIIYYFQSASYHQGNSR